MCFQYTIASLFYNFITKLSYNNLFSLLTLVMVITFLLFQGLDMIGIDFGYFTSYIINVVNGLSIGIGVGFGYVIAKRLFDAIFDK